MKRSARTYILSAAIVLLLSISFNQTALSQPPPPPPGGGHGLGGNQGSGPGQGAPIGGGLEIFLLLGAAYAGGKIYLSKREEGESEEGERGRAGE
jgi:hypothetical protein